MNHWWIRGADQVSSDWWCHLVNTNRHLSYVRCAGGGYSDCYFMSDVGSGSGEPYRSAAFITGEGYGDNETLVSERS